MELSRGQQEYLLELLSAEYTIPADYRESLKAAVDRYATAHYTQEELDFLLDTPQSLSAILLLNTTDSLQAFARHFALWANCVEYNAFDSNALLEATLVNPDPSSRQKLLQVMHNGEQYQIIPASELRYMATPREQETLSAEHNPTRRLMPAPQTSAFSFRTLEGLMQEFLTFADQKEMQPFAPSRQPSEEYAAYLEKELHRTATRQYSWSELRGRARALSAISSTYQWPDRADGLIVPSNIAFVNYLNALPAKHSRPAAQPVTASYNSPFTRVDHLMAQLSPKRLFQNLRNLRPPRLPAFSFPNQPKHQQSPYGSDTPSPTAAANVGEAGDPTIASSASPNSAHSEPAAFSTASKMPAPKKVHRAAPVPPAPPLPQSMGFPPLPPVPPLLGAPRPSSNK